MADDLVKTFQSIGLSEAKAKETLKNSNLSKMLENVIRCAKDSRPGHDLTSVGSLLYHIASKVKPQIYPHVGVLARYVATEKLSSEVRLNAAIEYLMQFPDPNLNVTKFEEASGVGIVVTDAMIKEEVNKIISAAKDELVAKRYRYPLGQLLSDARKNLKWADGKGLKNEVDDQVLALLGPKTEADSVPQPKGEKKAKSSVPVQGPKVAKENSEASSDILNGEASITELMRTKVNFHKPGENYKTEGFVISDKTMSLIEAHLKRTGGKVRTRFPPEPNGILHVGHAKAININFGYAAAHDGVCFLRYDDTNPEKEEEKFFTGIKDVVEWLGYKPYKITHSSDNFDQLYEWAKVLIKKDLAYVCHQRVEDIRGFNPPPSPWRTRPVEESLQLFEDMKNGKFDEGEATLRMKITLEEGKQDPVAYRIKYAAHHRTGNKWCIYPTYDYTHCLCDSLEDITHSLCTKEFQSRRSSYYWLCNAVETYCPVQWEYGRLNVSYTVVSKRKIAKLISTGVVRDWDDPRLFTLTALRRRGFTAEAINSFCARLGLTGAQMTIDPTMLEAAVRSHLNVIAPRTMVVLEALKVNIVNFDGPAKTVAVPDFPEAPEKSSHNVAFSSVIYIERSDFKLEGDKNFRRLTKDQSVGLRHAGFVISFTKIVRKDELGNITEIEAECCTVEKIDKKPKAFIHWVSDPIKIEVRLYEQLFKHKNPEDANEVPGGFLSDINENSLSVVEALADKHLSKAEIYQKFQFERLGFFSVDPDSCSSKLVFNRTVNLKEDSGK